MATATGKKARRTHGGNRYSVKRRGRHAKFEKIIRDNHMNPETYRAMKLEHKKSVAKRKSDR